MNTEEARNAVPTLKDDGGGRAFRVLRGASWYNDHPVDLESRFRGSVSPQIRVGYLGFRCVLEEGEFR